MELIVLWRIQEKFGDTNCKMKCSPISETECEYHNQEARIQDLVVTKIMAISFVKIYIYIFSFSKFSSN